MVKIPLPVHFATGAWLTVQVAFFPLAAQPGITGQDLPGAVALSGSVVDPEGRPVEHTHVIAVPKGPVPACLPAWGHSATWSRPDGSYRLTGLADDVLYELTAWADGFSPVTVAAQVPPSIRPAPPVRFVLPRGQALSGRVVDPSGLPLAGAVLTLTPAPGTRKPASLVAEFDWSFETSSDAAGRFDFGRLPAIRFDLSASHPDFASTSLPGIEVTSGPTLDLGDLVFDAGASLAGQVMDAQGRPVPGAEVFVFPYPRPAVQDGGRRLPAPAGPDGRFAASNLQRSERYEIVVDHPGYLRETLYVATADTAEPIPIRLRAARSVSGRVVGPEGEGVAGARLEVKVPFVAVDSAQASEQGEFRASNLPGGDLMITVTADGYRGRVLSGLRLPPEKDLLGVEIKLERGAVLEGTVRDAHGEPQANVNVSARHQTTGTSSGTRSDPKGHYRLSDLEPGPHEVRAAADTGEKQAASIEVGLQSASRLDLTFEATEEWTVSGRLIDEAGKPMDGLELRLGFMGVTESPRWYKATSQRDGSFRFSKVLPGSYQIIVPRPEDRAVLSEPGEIQVMNGDVGGLEILFGEGTAITGRLLGVSPADLARVSVGASKCGGYHSGTVARDGTYRIRHLPPGECEIFAFLGSSQTGVRTTLTIEPGSTDVTLDLDLSMDQVPSS